MTTINQASKTLIQLWTQATTINRKLDANLGAVHGIGFAEFMVLHHLNAAPQLMQRRIDLASLLSRSASGITKMLNPMEKIGLVSKEVNPRDARVSLVKLTESGLKTYQQASDSMNQIAAGALGKLNPADVMLLDGFLTELNL